MTVEFKMQVEYKFIGCLNTNHDVLQLVCIFKIMAVDSNKTRQFLISTPPKNVYRTVDIMNLKYSGKHETKFTLIDSLI